MSLVFNSGNGGAICDACRTMVASGNRVLRPHRVEPDPSHAERRKHYCEPPCGGREEEPADGGRVSNRAAPGEVT